MSMFIMSRLESDTDYGESMSVSLESFENHISLSPSPLSFIVAFDKYCE